MVVTPFGDLDLDDEVALERFIDAHDRRHAVYASSLGIPGTILRSKIDGDWMLRHAAKHVVLATQTGIDLSSADVKVLALNGKWRTNQELIDLSDLHSRHHLKIDQQLKIT
jgi:hypothetical protein